MPTGISTCRFWGPVFLPSLPVRETPLSWFESSYSSICLQPAMKGISPCYAENQKVFALGLWTELRPPLYKALKFVQLFAQSGISFRKVGQISYFLGLLKYLNMASTFLTAGVQRKVKPQPTAVPHLCGGMEGEERATATQSPPQTEANQSRPCQLSDRQTPSS